MNNFYLSFSVVFPLFMMMALGYFLKRINIFNDTFLKELNNLCFKVFLPLILFVNIYKSDFQSVFNPKLVMFSIVSVFVAFLALVLIVPLFEKENINRGVIVQGIFRSNFILFGLPIAITLYGEANASTAAVLIAFVIPLFNALSVFALSIFSSKKTSVRQIAFSIIKNPLIIGSLVAFFFVLSGIKLPTVVEVGVSNISNVATPLALIILGGSFNFSGLNKYTIPLTFAVFGKLVLMPLVFVSVAILFGFRGIELASLFAIFASPTAVSSFTMAQSMNANDELAGQIVVVDSIFAVVTIFLGISVLVSFGLI